MRLIAGMAVFSTTSWNILPRGTKFHKIILGILLLVAPCLYGQTINESNFQTILISGSGRPLNANTAVCTLGLTTTGASISGNVATLTFGSNPQTAGYLRGSLLTVSIFTGADTIFNGTFPIAAVSGTTISYFLVHAPATASSVGLAFQTGTQGNPCAPLATIFTDYSGATQAPNPSTSGPLGNVSIWAPSGVYNLQYYGLGIVTKVIAFSIGGTGGGSGSPNLEVSFANVTSATLNASSLNTANLLFQCYDNGSPNANPIEANATLNLSTLVITFGFTVPQSGYCAVNGSGGGGGSGPTIGAVLLSPIITQSIVQPTSTALNVTSPGLFTNTQNNQPFTSIINGLNFHAMDPFFLSDSFAAGVEVPAGSTVQQADGLTGMCESQSTATNCVGLFGIGRTRVNGGSAWGGNDIASDVDSLGVHHTGTFIHGFEDDIQCTDVTTSCFGHEVFGAVGNVTPNVGGGYRLGSLSNFGASALWPYGFGDDPGVTNTWGIVNTQCLSPGTCPSQAIVFYGNSGSTQNPSAIQGTALGGFTIQPLAGAGVTVGGMVDPRGAVELDTPGAAVPDALNANVTHGINMSSVSPAIIALVVGQRADQLTFMTYLQARSNLGSDNTAYPIQLNPLGGAVGINSNTAIPIEPLDVVGNVRSSTGFISGAGTSPNVTVTVGNSSLTSLGTSVSAGVCQSEGTVTVTGAATATDSATPFLGAALPATFQTGIRIDAEITSANTITIYLCNPTAAPITPAATVINVKVIR